MVSPSTLFLVLDRFPFPCFRLFHIYPTLYNIFYSILFYSSTTENYPKIGKLKEKVTNLVFEDSLSEEKEIKKGTHN